MVGRKAKENTDFVFLRSGRNFHFLWYNFTSTIAVRSMRRKSELTMKGFTDVPPPDDGDFQVQTGIPTLVALVGCLQAV